MICTHWNSYHAWVVPNDTNKVLFISGKHPSCSVEELVRNDLPWPYKQKIPSVRWSNSTYSIWRRGRSIEMLTHGHTRRMTQSWSQYSSPSDQVFNARNSWIAQFNLSIHCLWNKIMSIYCSWNLFINSFLEHYTNIPYSHFHDNLCCHWIIRQLNSIPMNRE